MSKKDIFLKEHLHKLPLYLSNYKIKEFSKTNTSNEHSNVTRFEKFPVYHSDMTECKLSLKPISKIMIFDE